MRLGHAIAIDIPRHGVLLVFVDSLETFKELDRSNLAELAMLVVAVCPPKLSSVVLRSQDAAAGVNIQGLFANLHAMVVPLTHNELRRLARKIKTDRLAISSIIS